MDKLTGPPSPTSTPAAGELEREVANAFSRSGRMMKFLLRMPPVKPGRADELRRLLASGGKSSET